METGDMPEMPAMARALAVSLPSRILARRVILPWILGGERPVGEGLEIGAGSGAMSAALLAVSPTLRIVATDYDAEMVHTAQRTLAPACDRASVERVDAAQLPFADGRFDFVLSAAMLHHVVAWEKALAEAIRVLRPGGRLIGYDLLDAAPIRLMHFGHAHAHDTRMLRAGQLESELARLQVTNVRTRTALRGLVVKFAATKSA
jgi:ubiquinone/menaquinone biosynthesis C-methylase UbiE